MSKVKKVFKSVTNLLGLGTPAMPDMPVPETPAAAAPMAKADAGAIVNIGSSRNDQRLSGGGAQSIGRQQDIFSGLGLGGLRV